MFRMKPIFLFVLSGLGTCRPAVEIPEGTRTTLTHAVHFLEVDVNWLYHWSLPCSAEHLGPWFFETAWIVPRSRITWHCCPKGVEDPKGSRSWKRELESRGGGVLRWKGAAFRSPCSQVPKLGKIFTLPFSFSICPGCLKLEILLFQTPSKSWSIPDPSPICWNCRQVPSLQLHLLGWQTFPLFPAWFSAAVTCKH